MQSFKLFNKDNKKLNQDTSPTVELERKENKKDSPKSTRSVIPAQQLSHLTFQRSQPQADKQHYKALTIPNASLREPLLTESQRFESDIIDTAELKPFRSIIIDISELERQSIESKRSDRVQLLTVNKLHREAMDQIMLADPVEKLKFAEQILEEIQNRVLELFHNPVTVTPGFFCSLITFLGSTAGYISLCIRENRFDGPFFAAQAAGLAMLALIYDFFLMCILSCKENPCYYLGAIGAFAAILKLQPAIDDYYGGPAYAAEGAGILGLTSLVSLFFTCAQVPKKEPYDQLFLTSQDLKKALNVLKCIDPGNRDTEEKTQTGDYAPLTSLIEEKKHEITRECIRIGFLKNAIFKALPELNRCNNLIVEYAADYPKEIEESIDRLHVAFPKH